MTLLVIPEKSKHEIDGFYSSATIVKQHEDRTPLLKRIFSRIFVCRILEPLRQSALMRLKRLADELDSSLFVDFDVSIRSVRIFLAKLKSPLKPEVSRSLAGSPLRHQHYV